jgi:hypothetical protein
MTIKAMLARHGIKAQFNNPTHEPIHYGNSTNNKPLLYVVMGDSTAAETGSFFKKDRSLFAPDKFHPNDRG